MVVAPGAGDAKWPAQRVESGDEQIESPVGDEPSYEQIVVVRPAGRGKTPGIDGWVDDSGITAVDLGDSATNFLKSPYSG